MATHIACAARIPGTTNCRYGTPSTPPVDLSTRLPRPRPSDNRNIRGDRKRPKILPRQVRLYAVNQDPKTGRQLAGGGGRFAVLTVELISPPAFARSGAGTHPPESSGGQGRTRAWRPAGELRQRRRR